MTGVAVQWSGHSVPFVQSGDHWVTTVGVDLDSRPGAHAVDVTFRYADGHTRVERQPVEVRAEKYPTTELTVEDRYVELSPEDQARASARGRGDERHLREDDAGALLDDAVPGAGRRRDGWAQLRSSARIQWAAAGAAFRAPIFGRKTGTPIYAANRGRVVLAKDLFYSGNAVFIDHGLGLYTSYLHLSQIKVAVGDWVERGQLLGLSGATGRVTGPHLHWGVRILDARVDPFSLVRIGAP